MNLPGTHVPLKALAAFTRQLGALLKSGLTIHESLGIAVAEVAQYRKLQQTVAQIQTDLQNGSSLSQAMKSHPDVFDPLYRSVVFVGEESGTLDRGLKELADDLEHQLDLRGKIIGAVAYPLIMLAISAGAMFVVYSVFLPSVSRIYERIDKPLPLPTRIVSWLVEWTTSYGLLVAVLIIALVIAHKRYGIFNNLRAKRDLLVLHIPVIGRLIRDRILSRTTNALATLLRSGVNLTDGLKIVVDATTNRTYRQALEAIRNSVIEGGDLVTPMRQSGVFPPTLIGMVLSGERSGDLPEMLEQAARAYNREFEVRVNVLARLIGPVMMLITAGIVLLVLLSVMLPLFSM